MGLGYTYRCVLIGLRLDLGKGVGVEFWEGLGLRSVQPRRLPLHTGGVGGRAAPRSSEARRTWGVYPCGNR